MPCLSRPISSQLPLITSALLYKVIFHTTGRICSAHAAESLESFNHHPASTVAPVWPLLQGQHSTGCIPAAPARLLGALGAHPLSKQKGGKPQAGGHTKQPCPARGAGRSTHVPGGWVMRDFAGSSQRERSYHCLPCTNS